MKVYRALFKSKNTFSPSFHITKFLVKANKFILVGNMPLHEMAYSFAWRRLVEMESKLPLTPCKDMPSSGLQSLIRTVAPFPVSYMFAYFQIIVFK